MRPRSKISPIPAEGPHHTGTLFVQGVPRTTKQAFKAACAKNGQDMRDVIITFMRDYAVKAKVA